MLKSTIFPILPLCVKIRLRGRAERLRARVGHPAPLVLLSHAARGDEAEGSRVPHDLPQGESLGTTVCTSPGASETFWESSLKTKNL